MADEAIERVVRALKMTETVDNQHRVEASRRSLQALLGILLSESGKCDDALPLLQKVPADDLWWQKRRFTREIANTRRNYIEKRSSAI